MTQMAERIDQPKRAHASRAVDAAPRTSAPVKWWAAVGAAYLAIYFVEQERRRSGLQ